MPQLGVNIYRWDLGHQNRLLVECLGPAVADLTARGWLQRFWFDRYDARGPHVFAVFDHPSGRGEDLGAVLGDRLRSYFDAHPSAGDLAAGEIRARHDACRGRAQSAADRLPGWAANDTFLAFPHSAAGAPRSWDRLGVADGRFWDLVDGLSRWSLARLAEPAGVRQLAAIRWLASLDLALARRGLGQDYWRFHVFKDLPGLRRRLADGQGSEADAVARLVSPSNRRTCDRAWVQVTADGPPWAGIQDLVDRAAATGGRPAQDWTLLREIAHATLKQLGLVVRQHIPLVAHAWGRHLPQEAPVP